MQVGTQVIDTTLHIIIKTELSNASNWWWKTHLSSVISSQINIKPDPTEVLVNVNQIKGISKPPDELL